MRRLFEQFAKFTGVGIVATVIDFAVMVFLTEVLQVTYLVSSTLSFVVSVVFNYMASMRVVFRRREGMSLACEMVIFFALSLVGLGLNELCMWWFVTHLAFDYRVAKVAATVIVTLWNFTSRKLALDGRSSS